MDETLVSTIDETCIDEYRPGYVDVLIEHFAQEFDWSEEFAHHVLREAMRLLAVSALPPAGEESKTAQVMVPSPIVDKVVDAIFLDSPLLMWLEQNVFGVRLLHVPHYAHGMSDLLAIRYTWTRMLLTAGGYVLDPVIWPHTLSARPCGVGGAWDDCLVTAAK
jgi:hypothetical protein